MWRVRIGLTVAVVGVPSRSDLSSDHGISCVVVCEMISLSWMCIAVRSLLGVADVSSKYCVRIYRFGTCGRSAVVV
jgi:hypothetical protein